MSNDWKRVRVFGEPKGQPRARAFARNGMVRMYDPATAEGWKAQIAAAMKDHYGVQPPLSGPLRISVLFIMPRPKSHFGTGKNAETLKESAPKFYATKPDRDNLDKAMLDALVASGFLSDDCIVVAGMVAKVYAPLGVRPGAIIQWRNCTDDDYYTLTGAFSICME